MKRVLLLLTLLSFVFESTAYAQLDGPNNPDSLSVQGRLTDLVGDPVVDGTYDIVFTLYKNSNNVWQETHTNVPVSGGVFNAVLGTSTSLGDIPFDQAMELGIKVDTDPEISPRVPLTGAPYALGLRGLYAVDADDGTNEAPNLIGGASNNSVASGVVGATIGGGGGSANSVAGPQSVEGDWGTVGGGLSNTASGFAGTVGGGYSNLAEGDSSTVAGGAHNWARYLGAAIGGGIDNLAYDWAAVAGGSGNAAGGTFSFIGGGEDNETNGSRSVLAGGSDNLTSDGYTVISGGQQNTAEGAHSVIGGGIQNTTSGSAAAVLGGAGNSASGEYSALGGGTSNEASGDYSTVPGGQGNLAAGHTSFASGSFAKADHGGSFVWQDSSAYIPGYALHSTVRNEWLVRTSGGATFLSAAAPDLTTGVTLANGSGAWADLSSKASKTGFDAVDPVDYLERAASLNIMEWSYRTESGVTHVGPMAEDFYAAFGHGPNDKSITTVDASGVALAAIQGLYELVKEQQAEIERLRAIVENH